jgi:hypothetical protein
MAAKFLTKKKAVKLFYTKPRADQRFINVGEKVSDSDALDGVDGSAFRHIQLYATAAVAGDGATVQTGNGASSGVVLPGSGNPTVAWSFVLPPDYVSGSPLTLRLLWHTPGTSCAVAFRKNSLSVARAGGALFGNTSFVTAVTGEVLSAGSTADVANLAEYRIDVPAPAGPLQAGDSLWLELFRSSASVDDTCTDDFLVHAAR